MKFCHEAQVHASLGDWAEAAQAYGASAEAWAAVPQQAARAWLGRGVALDRLVRAPHPATRTLRAPPPPPFARPKIIRGRAPGTDTHDFIRRYVTCRLC